MPSLNPDQEVSATAGCPQLCWLGFLMSPSMETHSLSGNLFHCQRVITPKNDDAEHFTGQKYPYKIFFLRF